MFKSGLRWVTYLGLVVLRLGFLFCFWRVFVGIVFVFFVVFVIRYIVGGGFRFVGLKLRMFIIVINLILLYEDFLWVGMGLDYGYLNEEGKVVICKELLIRREVDVVIFGREFII